MNDSSSSDAAAGLFAALFGLGFTSFSFLWTCMYCFIIIISLVGMVLWIVMLIDVARREESDFPEKGENQKTIWLLVVILGGSIGALVYYFLVFKKAKDMVVVKSSAPKAPAKKLKAKK